MELASRFRAGARARHRGALGSSDGVTAHRRGPGRSFSAPVVRSIGHDLADSAIPKLTHSLAVVTLLENFSFSLACAI